eukprot:3888780-Amphidinium_carterae.2
MSIIRAAHVKLHFQVSQRLRKRSNFKVLQSGPVSESASEIRSSSAAGSSTQHGKQSLPIFRNARFAMLTRSRK